MQEVNDTALKKLEDELNQVLREFPKKRKELHRKFAEAAKREVDAAIGAAHFQGGGERLAAMQTGRVGSYGGYAVVRARNSRDGGGTGRDSMGAITNYNENGHRIRPPGKRKGRAKMLAVNGRHFYQTASQRMEQKAREIAGEFAAELAKQLEG